MYKGNSHSNMTELIEGNATLSIGAPFFIPIDDGAVILASVRPMNSFQQMWMGSFTLSYQLEAEVYPWYEKIFLGKSKLVYYVGLSGFIALIPLLLLTYNLCCFILILCTIRRSLRNS